MKKRISARGVRRAWDILALLLPAVVLLLPVPALSYPVFRILGFSLVGISLLLLLLTLPRIVKSGKALLKTACGGRLGGFVSRAALLGGILLNLVYAAFRFAVGLYTRSLWFCAEAVFYLLLCAARVFLVEEDRRIGAAPDPQVRERIGWGVYRRGGFLFLFLAIAASGIVTLALREEHTRGYTDAVVVGAILFSAWRAGLALFQIFSHRRKLPLLSFAKLLSLCTALLSIFALQTTLFARFGADFKYRFPLNAATGTAVALSLFAIGGAMLARAQREIKRTARDR